MPRIQEAANTTHKTIQGGDKAHIQKCEPAIAHNAAPARNPDHRIHQSRGRQDGNLRF
jgi:hypothetical protein